MKNTTKVFFAVTLAIASWAISAQEALLSSEEQRYDFLALNGEVTRPYLNYRTLSDSAWTEDRPAFRLYGPELFTSFNSANPYGQNDGALWQGKGFNASLTAGARLETHGFELTLKPQLACSQNASYELLPAGNNANYSPYAYYMGTLGYIDVAQRYGNDPYWVFSWGDSEIRYTWQTLTAGFGTQSIWLGPARINPILHSNNAAPYPKLDIGLRRQAVTLPFLKYYAGDVEARAWWGKTTESDYFDNVSSNDHNLITGLSLSYAPSFIPGATFGFHRTMLSKWDSKDYSSIFTLLWPFMEGNAGKDERDQRGSITFDYLLPQVGAELYFEYARNDYSSSMDHLIRYPFHAQGYTLGVRKSVRIAPDRGIRGQFVAELSNLESSRDYEILPNNATFYAHHIITQGYTNEGQWLGAGIGTGGNSQYMGFEVFFPEASINVFVQRVNPNNDYVWFLNIEDTRQNKVLDEKRFRTDLSLGINGDLSTSKKTSIQYAFVATDSHNYDYQPNPKSIHRYNIHISTGFSYKL
jgi:hypothetical protein